MRPSGFGLLFICSMASTAGAQRVEVQLREEATHTPVAGALVRLLGARGVAAQALSGASGRVTLPAQGPGSYRVRVDRIGWEAFTTDPFDLDKTAVRTLELTLPLARVSLPPIEVRASSRCGRQVEEGGLAAALWREIEKALTAGVLTEQSGAMPLLVTRFQRESRRDGSRSRQWTTYAGVHRGKPFTTVSPRELSEFGFVVVDGRDSVVYSAPDAELLLSDNFVLSHCFRAIQGDSGLAGLAFTPSGARRVVEVEGTLWVHRLTTELRYLEFTYVVLPNRLANRGLGGRVDFRRLPSGAWIVGAWQVRTPLMEEVPVRATKVPPTISGRANFREETTRFAGFVDLGGRAEPWVGGAEPDGLGMIRGRVTTGNQDEGLPGVVVTLPGEAVTTVTDSAGHFTLAARRPGVQLVLASHPRLRLSGAVDSLEAVVSIGETTEVIFHAPAVETLARRSCGGGGRRSGVVGQLLDGSGQPARRVGVTAEWVTAAGATRRERAWTDQTGYFALCNLPADEALILQTFDHRGSAVRQRVVLEWGVYRWIEMKLLELGGSKE